MSKEIITYIVFGIALILALIFDLGLLSKKNKEVTIRKAFQQTIFWVFACFGIWNFCVDGRWQTACTGIHQRLFNGMEFKH